MPSKLPHTYKIPTLISLTLFVVMIALRVEREPFAIAFLFLGSLAGTFLLALDYFLYAYFIDPEAEFSKMLRGYTGHKQLSGAFAYIQYHKNELKDKTLNSALFQMVLGGLMIFVVNSNAYLFIKALVVSAFANSIYVMLEEYAEGRIREWFWAFKINLTKNTVYVYTVILVLMLMYTLNLF